MAKVIKALREQRELSQPELAKRAQVAQSYIAMLETGEKQNPSLDILKRLAKALKVPVADLLG